MKVPFTTVEDAGIVIRALRKKSGIRIDDFALTAKYAQHYPEEPGLLSKSTLPAAHSGLEAFDESPDEDKAPALGVRNEAQLALERRILRILRYIIFPEMLARLPS